jgi:hypothetical protein
MNQDIREEWTRRLRSGEYEQGRALLCRVFAGGRKEYCCWGVLCDMAVEDDVIAAELVGTTVIYGPARARHMPPLQVLVWAGVPYMGDGYAVPAGIFDQLAEMNDVGVPFSEIANRIDDIGGDF